MRSLFLFGAGLIVGLLALATWHRVQSVDPFDAYRAYLHDHNAAKRALSSPPEILLLGDSHIQFLGEHMLSRPAMNLGIGGLTAAELSQNLRDYGLDDFEGLLIVGVGVNDLMRHPQSAAQNISDLIEKLNARGRPWLLMTIPPVAADHSWPVRQAQITALNDSISRQCASPCRLVDTHALLTAEDGSLRRAADSGDGLHLSRSGYTDLTASLNRMITDSP